MIRLRIMFFLVLILIYSCRKDDFVVKQIINESLNIEPFNGDTAIFIGKWIWYKSNHQFGECQYTPQFETLTPLTENESIFIEFFKNGRIDFIRNNEVISTLKNSVNTFEFVVNKYNFGIQLNNDVDKNFWGEVSIDSLWFKNNVNFPFEIEGDCETYVNYFVKE